VVSGTLGVASREWRPGSAAILAAVR
jgi:hypothetical protein